MSEMSLTEIDCFLAIEYIRGIHSMCTAENPRSTVVLPSAINIEFI